MTLFLEYKKNHTIITKIISHLIDLEENKIVSGYIKDTLSSGYLSSFDLFGPQSYF